MPSPLVLSLFPGVGLLDRAFEEFGFTVVRGPDILWGGEVKTFHAPPGRFDGVIGGPPCQAFSTLQRLVKHNREKARARGNTNSYAEAKNLIPEFERIVTEAAPLWWLMENVPAAPLPCVAGYRVCSCIIDNREIPRDQDDAVVGAEQRRERRFSFGTYDGRALDIARALFFNPRYVPAVCASGSTWVPVGEPADDATRSIRTRRGRVYGDKTERYWRHARAAQGLPDDYELPGFTVRGKIQAIGNGVPLPLGRALARAVRAAVWPEGAPEQIALPGVGR
jgi:DNA (cytosine-5)-methyltransferase 1